MIADIHFAAPQGRVQVPPSKSMSHRTLLAAALARGQSRIWGLGDGRDIQATLGAVAQMGARLRPKEQWIDVEGRGGIATLLHPIDCGESATTLRFLVPVLSLTGQQVEFTGARRLFQRPQTVYQKIFDAQGLLFVQSDRGIVVKGRLVPGAYTVPGNVSSQFISGLLFALPLLHRPSTLRVLPPFQSRPYVEMTLAVLREFGVQVFWDTEEKDLLHIPALQRFQNRECRIDGDYSQAAILAVLGAVRGGVRLCGLQPRSLQGDAVILDILRRCGAKMEWQGGELVLERAPLTATTIDLADCPDLGPILMVLALFCEGTTVIQNAQRLRIKESDRIHAMQQELAKFGARILEEAGTITIEGGPTVLPGVLDGHDDHRVVMSLAAAGLAAGWDVSIRGAQAVDKSWPEFFEALRGLGASVEQREEPSRP